MMSPGINNVTIITIKGVDYCCIIYGVSKSDVIHLLEIYILGDCGFTKK